MRMNIFRQRLIRYPSILICCTFNLTNPNKISQTTVSKLLFVTFLDYNRISVISQFTISCWEYLQLYNVFIPSSSPPPSGFQNRILNYINTASNAIFTSFSIVVLLSRGKLLLDRLLECLISRKSGCRKYVCMNKKRQKWTQTQKAQFLWIEYYTSI